MPVAGEREFTEFVWARWLSLTRTAYLLVGDRERAEDLVQTVLAKLWLAWPRVMGGSPDAYARRALVTTAVSWWRRRWRAEQPTLTVPDRPLGDETETVALRDSLRRALLELPPRQRAVLVLRYAEDLPETVVGEVLGCSVGTVKTLAHRGLNRLRDLDQLNPVDGLGHR